MPLLEELIHYRAVEKTFTGVLIRNSRNVTLPGILLAPNMMGTAASSIEHGRTIAKKATLSSLPICTAICPIRQRRQLSVCILLRTRRPSGSTQRSAGSTG